MSVPGIVQERLAGEEVTQRVSLGGEDEVFVTGSRTLIYRSDGLLRDESVEEYSHDAELLSVSEGRRKTRLTLEYAIDGTKEFTLPSGSADAVIRHVLAGVLRSGGVIGEEEQVVATYRFSELTLVITTERLVKHIGEAVWDDEFEEYPFERLTGLEFEDGSVATQIVLETDGRPTRIKAPSDRAAEVRRYLEQAVCNYYGVDTLAELNAVVAPEEDEAPADDAPDGGAGDPTVDFGEGVDPLGANTEDPADPDPDPDTLEVTADDGGAGTEESRQYTSSQRAGESPHDAGESAEDPTPEPTETEPTRSDRHADAETDPLMEAATDAADAESEASGASAFEEAGFEPADTRDELKAEVEELREAVERQNQLLVKQQQTIEQLIEELSRGR